MLQQPIVTCYFHSPSAFQLLPGVKVGGGQLGEEGREADTIRQLCEAWPASWDCNPHRGTEPGAQKHETCFRAQPSLD